MFKYIFTPWTVDIFIQRQNTKEINHFLNAKFSLPPPNIIKISIQKN